MQKTLSEIQIASSLKRNHKCDALIYFLLIPVKVDADMWWAGAFRVPLSKLLIIEIRTSLKRTYLVLNPCEEMIATS